MLTRNVNAFFTFIALLFFAQFTQAQGPKGCEDFKNQSIGWWQGNNVAISIQQPGPSNSASDYFMQAEDLSGVSYLRNPLDYDGDWTLGGGCFCYDFKVISGQHPIANALIIRSGNLIATFTVNFSIDQSDGWVSICAPVNQCTGNTLPSNSYGSWTMTSGASTCANWNSLITNVTEVRLTFDDEEGPGEKVGYDNLCFSECKDDGAFCCPGVANLINNGNFELGNSGFSSNYLFQGNYSAGSVPPGFYGVGTAAEALAVSPNWIVDDHSGCQGYDNDHVMLINGHTQQASNLGNMVWSQTVSGLNPEDTYTFCGQFKNLPTCAFDVLPRVSIQIVSGPTIPYTVINAGPNSCDWQELSATFQPNGTGVTIQIFVDHQGNGDGADLAIDDLALQYKEPAFIPLYGASHNNPASIYASYDDIGPADDILPDPSCEYEWTVIDLTAGFTMGTGNAAGNSNTSDPWLLTTNFPGLIIQLDHEYRIELAVFNCDCQADNEVGTEVKPEDPGFRKVFSSGRDRRDQHEVAGKLSAAVFTTNVSFSPNPTSGLLKAFSNAQNLEVELVDLSGRVLEKWSLKDSRELDISTYSKGIYYLKYTADGEKGVTKIVLQ